MEAVELAAVARVLHENALMAIPFKLQLKNVVNFVFFLFTGHCVNCVMAAGFMLVGLRQHSQES